MLEVIRTTVAQFFIVVDPKQTQFSCILDPAHTFQKVLDLKSWTPLVQKEMISLLMLAV
jgi:hypothetical protein